MYKNEQCLVKQRRSNIELFRIITMLIIIAHHYVVNSGLLNYIPSKSYLEYKDLFLLVLGWGGKTGINCFVLITGYFMCKSNVTLLKFIKLLSEVIFYNLIIYFLFSFFGYQSITFDGLKNCIFPFFYVANGFTSCFLIFYLFIPYINKLINTITQKELERLIVLCLFVYTFLPSFLEATVVFNYITWYFVIYIIASYIRLYPKEIFTNKKITFLLFMFFLTLSIYSVISMAFNCIKMGIPVYECYFYVSDSNKVLALLTAVSAFIFFLNMDIRYSKLINMTASSIFGVLQIHTNSDTMRTWLWHDVCKNVEVYLNAHLLTMVMHAFFCITVIFISCTFIDQLRVFFIEKPYLKYLQSKLAR